MEIAEFLDGAAQMTRSWSTGLSVLDELTGGARPGRFWIVTGGPEEGRSTLLTQFAFRLAVVHGLQTQLILAREHPDRVRERLLSLATLRSLAIDGRPQPNPSDVSTDWAGQVAELRASSLWVQAGGVGVPGFGRPDSTTEQDRAVLIDDMHVGGEHVLESVLEAAEGGAFILGSLPRHLVIGDDGKLIPTWVEPADLVLDLSSTNASINGSATLAVERNRWGPLGELRFENQCYRGRFVDCAGPARRPPSSGN